MTTRTTTRRQFLRTAAAAGLSAPLVAIPRAGAAPVGGELRVGAIGVGGKGWGDIIETTKEHARVVAICDIDAGNLAKAAKRFPDAKTFTDWRELLRMDGLDAVTVSTPDHTHAPATMTAMRRGLHVYCQKPLTHSVWEARQIALAATKYGVVTQMGTQGRSTAESMITVELLRRKAIGRIRQIHLWTNRPIWPQGLERPPAKPVPAGVSWDTWIGVAPYRDYHDHLHGFAWRGWLDFGTGALGDIGCHSLVHLWDGLQLKAPTQIWSDGDPPNGETYPKSSVIHYAFPANDLTGGEFELIWYDGGALPDRKLFPFMPSNWKVPDGGNLIVGDDGFIQGHRLYPSAKFSGYAYPKVTGDDHYMQWTRACLDRSRKTLCPFDTLAGPVTEAVLLGNVALRFPGKKLNWDTAACAFPGFPDADRFLRRTYRKGWTIDGLG
ncbi:MAG: Gfo/Idh/MocA family oxidoreductase [Akkermansiaceae bacterium]|nr:Gfo/Idh/MocA family oxidoreductase [Akkermansiaceae bacterium]MCF7730205.1 Gfo/Idh/MocA family oxidoreductase [Akkermansiaceae bacterium]